jgi:cytochrome P450
MKLALHVITGAGFGVPFTWDSSSSDEIWPSHNLSFRSALDQTLHHLIPLMLLPRWVLRLPVEYLRVTRESYLEFGGYMRELLEREKGKVKEGMGDTTNLLGALAKHAREREESGEAGLSDEEIIGNTFIFLIAGHETRYSPRIVPPLSLYPSFSFRSSLPILYTFAPLHSGNSRGLTGPSMTK